MVLHERELHFNVTVHNTSKLLTCRFMLALKYFLRVSDVTQYEMIGVEGCSYIDQEDLGEIKKMESALKINGLTDFFILDTPNEFYIQNTVLDRKFRIQKQNFPEILVWNPWTSQVTTIKDISDDEYTKLFYFAVGNIRKATVLAPGGIFETKVVICRCK